MKKVAVILAGCGYLDGAEIRESVLTLLALESQGALYRVFSIDKAQHHVVDHHTGEEIAGESRNVLQESARIARGEISELNELQVSEFDALILPGGFGAAKNLSTFAFEGHNGVLEEEVSEVISAFKNVGKPIGAICISPALLALCFGKSAPVLTIGFDQGTAAELEKLGAIHQQCATADCVIDPENKLVTTPAYMDGAASLPNVYSGISRLVKAVLELIDK